jgi:hypothetical protein
MGEKALMYWLRRIAIRTEANSTRFRLGHSSYLSPILSELPSAKEDADPPNAACFAEQPFV